MIIAIALTLVCPYSRHCMDNDVGRLSVKDGVGEREPCKIELIDQTIKAVKTI